MGVIYECGSVVVMRYIGFLILLIPIYSALFAKHPSFFLSIK